MHKHVRVHESSRGSNRAKFWIGLLACLCVFLIQWHILWRIETLAATSMILLVKFVASYLKFHKSSCFSIESVLLRLTRVVIDDAWWICVWETGHHDVKNHLWWFSACHKADTIYTTFLGQAHVINISPGESANDSGKPFHTCFWVQFHLQGCTSFRRLLFL